MAADDHDTGQLQRLLTCSLCGEMIVDPARLKVCGHTFCTICLVRHLEKQRRCPQCNQRLRNPVSTRCYNFDLNLQELAYRFFPRESAESLRRHFRNVGNQKSAHLQLCRANLVLLARHLSVPNEKTRVRVVMFKKRLHSSVGREDAEVGGWEMTVRCPNNLRLSTLKKLFVRKFLQSTSGAVLHFFSADSTFLDDEQTIADLVLRNGSIDGLRPLLIVADMPLDDMPCLVDDMPILGGHVLRGRSSAASGVESGGSVASARSGFAPDVRAATQPRTPPSTEAPRAGAKRKRNGAFDAGVNPKQPRHPPTPPLNPAHFLSFLNMLNANAAATGSMPNPMLASLNAQRSVFPPTPPLPSIFSGLPPFPPMDAGRIKKEADPPPPLNQPFPPALIQKLLATAATHSRQMNAMGDNRGSHPPSFPPSMPFGGPLPAAMNLSTHQTLNPTGQRKPGAAITPIRRGLHEQLPSVPPSLLFANGSPPEMAKLPRKRRTARTPPDINW
ncbi:Polycomb group RING finger protein 3 [Aphelenchoides fujianensis]|nr:Polycomb group RING finger protein 3 [Aphelenchoides fujianensis]